MKIKPLYLTLKRNWFDMIDSGEKREEYREIKPYWEQRLLGKNFTHVEFRNGYGRHVPSILCRCLSIKIGMGKPEWGAPRDRQVFIISLGPPHES